MSQNRPSDELPEGFKSWRDFNKAKKDKRQLKQEYQIKKLEKIKQKELETAASTAAAPSKKKKGSNEPSTLSIAVPGSILDNAQSVELRTYLAGQIARAACVFKVDEIIVYDDVGIQDNVTTKTIQSLSDSGEVCPARRCCAQLARILQYLECPQYLRREFFPKHKDLDYAGLLNPLDAPHHMRQQDDGRFREGIVLPQPAKNGSYVNVGLLQHVKVNLPLQPGIRVTVEMIPTPLQSKRPLGKVVPPSQPQKEMGVYWGYSVRLASSFNTIFTECPYKEGYDVTIGTSERGNPIETTSFPAHQHVLVVFGGLAGIEAALEADDVLMVDNPALLFDRYINTCPDQGSRTIRTEEAILITLTELRTRLKPKVPHKSQQKEMESDEDIASEGSDKDSESDILDGIDKTLEKTNKTGEGEESFNSTSESCNQNAEFQTVKKRKLSEDSVKKPKKAPSNYQEIFNNSKLMDVQAETNEAGKEMLDISTNSSKTLGLKSKKNKKKRGNESI